jgi:hypothetical protein
MQFWLCYFFQLCTLAYLIKEQPCLGTIHILRNHGGVEFPLHCNLPYSAQEIPL